MIVIKRLANTLSLLSYFLQLPRLFLSSIFSPFIIFLFPSLMLHPQAEIENESVKY